jgi:hypothetical protein
LKGAADMQSKQDLHDFLEALFPAEESHFDPAYAVPPPYVVYRYDGNQDLVADDHNYKDVGSYAVELYTEKKDKDQHTKKLEEAFKAAQAPYDKTETWIQSEHMFQTMYTITIVGG